MGGAPPCFGRSLSCPWEELRPPPYRSVCWVSALQRRPPALPQDAVQAAELPQEPSVGDDASVVLHRLDGLHQRQVLSDHQVGQNQGGGAAHPHGAVDQDLP